MTMSNDSLSNATNCTKVPDSEWGRILSVVSNSVLMLVALTGNSVILFVFKTSKTMKNTTDILIANMAFSDLIFPVLVIPRFVVQLYIGETRWLVTGTIGLGLCKSVFFLQDLSTAVSILTILLITIDRFIAIVLPLRGFVIKERTCKILAALTWVVGFCIHGVYFKAYTLIYDIHNEYPLCVLGLDFNTAVIYYLALFVCFAVIPLAFIITVYTVIFINLRRQQRRIGISLSDPQKLQRSFRQRRILYLSFAIVVSFVICWAPVNVAAFLTILNVNSCILKSYLFVGYSLSYASSAVNPVITFLFSSKFRGALKERFRHRLERRRARHRSNRATNITVMEMQCESRRDCT